MLCRTLLTIIAASYLICVLILSGLQKEDLEVSMLKKLEHHGLDIDDMNNESLREDCLNNAIKNYKETIVYTEDPTTSTTTENTLRIERNQRRDVSTDKETNKTKLKAIMKYFTDLQNSEHDTKIKNVILDNYHIPQNSNLKYIFSDMMGYNSPQLNKNNLQASTTDVTYNMISKNMLSLWNTYRKQDVKTKDITTSEPTKLQTSSSSPIVIKNNDYSEIDIIQKVIANYITKNQMIPSTTQLPPKEDLDLARISDNIRRYLANTQSSAQNKLQNNVIITDDVNIRPVKTTYANKTSDNFYSKLNNEGNKLSDVRPSEPKKSVSAILKDPSNFPIEDMVRLDDQKSISNLFPVQNYSEHNKEMTNDTKTYNTNLENYKLLNHDGNFNVMNNLYTKMEKNNHPIIQEKSLPKDIIREIAESVKAMVLHELKNEMSTLKPHFRLITTEPSSTIATKDSKDKGIEATHIMEKFMELFQQFKSTKEKTIISGGSQMKVTERKDIKHEYKGPVKVIYSSTKPALSPYGVRSPTEQFAPIFDTQHNHEPMNAPKFIVLPNIPNPVYQVRQIDNLNVKTGLRLAPITIQTNSFEVPPLGIRIAKPPSIINQNIIVTTKSPNLRPRLDTHHSNYIHHIDRYKIEDGFKNRDDWQKSLSNPKRGLKSRSRDFAYVLDDDIAKVKKSDRTRLDKDRKRDYKPHFTKSDYNRMKLRNQEIKRFHERLENTDESKNTDERDECCKVRVASRQQLPLSSAKTRSRYDDVHFRNFLKTQQKVNDMLEKILATKTNGPQSVETT